jgi:acetyl-CoA C-acetyltransferase
VFISAGAEAVSRFAHGKADGMPDTKNPLFAGRRSPTASSPPTSRRSRCPTALW